MKKINYIFLSVLFLSVVQLFAQNKSVDSLQLLLNKATHDTTRLNLFINLSEKSEPKEKLQYAEPALNIVDKLLADKSYSLIRNQLLSKKGAIYEAFVSFYYMNPNKIDITKAIEYAEKEKRIYIEAENKEGLKNCLRILAGCYGMQGNILKQLNTYKEILPMAKELKDIDAEASLSYLIARIYFAENDTSLALSYYEESLKQFKIMKAKEKIAILLVQVGALYAYKKNIKKSEIFINEGLNLLKKEKDTAIIYTTYNMFGNAFLDIKDYDRAIENFLKALDYGKNDTSFVGEISSMLGKAYNRKKDYVTSLFYYNKAVQIAEINGEETRLAQTLIGAGNCLLMLHKNKEASGYAKRALILRKKQGALIGLMYAEKLMARSDSATGNYKEAYEHFSNYTVLRDKMDGEAIRKEATKQKFKEDFEKEKQEAILIQSKKDVEVSKEKKTQRIILISVVCGLLLVIVFAVFVFRNLRTTRKQNTIIEQKEKETQRQKHIVEEKHKEITDSINYAERIQRTFLATDELLNQNLNRHSEPVSESHKGIDRFSENNNNYFIFFKPKDVVSGDFYWAETLTNGNFILATADSTGHGVPGAIMSLLNITSLEKAVEHYTNPAEILNHTRQTIIKRLKRDGSSEGGKDGMDCSLIVFDFKNKQLQIAAANNPVWIIRNINLSEVVNKLELIEIKPDKMPVGKHYKDQEPFILHAIDLKEGDIIYTLTDGFPDQFGGEKGKKFMSKNLKELLLKNAHLPMHEQKKVIETAFANWIGTYEQVDDVTLIGVKV